MAGRPEPPPPERETLFRYARPSDLRRLATTAPEPSPAGHLGSAPRVSSGSDAVPGDSVTRRYRRPFLLASPPVVGSLLTAAAMEPAPTRSAGSHPRASTGSASAPAGLLRFARALPLSDPSGLDLPVTAAAARPHSFRAAEPAPHASSSSARSPAENRGGGAPPAPSPSLSPSSSGPASGPTWSPTSGQPSGQPASSPAWSSA